MFLRTSIILAAVVCGIAYAAVPQPAFLSLLTAFAAVTVPHTCLLFVFPRQSAAAPFAFWAAKFMLTTALLLQALRLLQEASALAALYFISGVVIAVVVNILVAAQYSNRLLRVQSN